MSFPQLGYPQYLSAAGPGAYGGERPGVLAAAAAAAASSGRPGTAELGAGAAAVTSVLGMYAAAGPYAGAPSYSAFLPYAADLSLFSQMVSAPCSARFSPGRLLPASPCAPGGGGGRVAAREGERRAGGNRRTAGVRGASGPARGPEAAGTWAARSGRRATVPPSRRGGSVGGSQEAAAAGPGRAARFPRTPLPASGGRAIPQQLWAARGRWFLPQGQSSHSRIEFIAW